MMTVQGEFPGTLPTADSALSAYSFSVRIRIAPVSDPESDPESNPESDPESDPE